MTTERLGTYAIQVDWDLSGTFTGTYDDVTADTVLEAPGYSSGVQVGGLGRDQARALSPPQESQCEFVLRNDTSLYSVESVSSALAGQVRPGRPVQFTITDAAGVATIMDDTSVTMDDADATMDSPLSVALFTGVLDEITQVTQLGDRSVTFRAKGNLSVLRGTNVTTALYANITTGAAMQHLLTAVFGGTTGWDVDDDVVSNGRTLAYWYGDGTNALEQALLLWSTEGYAAYLADDGDGTILFRGRNYRALTTRSTDVQATYGDDASALYHVGLRLTPGLRDIVNAPYVDIVQRALDAALSVIWEYSETITLNASGGATVLAKASDPFEQAATPVVTTDFTLSAGVVTVVLERTSGIQTTITFSGGTASATITNLQLRAKAWAKTADFRATTTLDTSASETEFGTQTFAPDVWPGLSPTDAVSLCDTLVIAYQQLRPIISVDVLNADRDHLYQIMRRQVGDRVHVVDTFAGVDLDVYIEAINHQVTVGRNHLFLLGCEKVVEPDWAIYDQDTYGNAVFGQ